MSFDAGGLIFRLQTVGAQLFQRDQADAKAAVERTGTAAKSAKTSVDGLGTATDETGKKARGAKAPLNEQANATEQLGKKTRRTGDDQKRQTELTEKQIAAAKELSTTLLLAGTAVGALVTLSVAKYASFDQQMSNTSAAVMATAQEQKALGEAALEAGADTAYSANEAAAAEEELAKAGQSVSDIVGGSLNGALSLAAAGQLGVARSAEIMATTLTQYGLKANQAAHVSDLLAAGAGKAQGSVDDLALALQYVGPVTAGLGISLEETAGVLAYFASQGILGEKAGTGLRGVIMSLTAPSYQAAKTMQYYGISVFDAQGNMRSMAEISESLREKLGGLTEAERSEALGRIFGNEQITAARILYRGGAQAIEEWTDKVNDSGYAAEQAAMRQDNLVGDIEKLGGAFDTALIRTGSGANDVLREMVQIVTSLVDGYTELPEWVQGGALAFGIATAAVLLLYGGTIKATIGLANLKRAADTLNVSMRYTSLVAGASAIAITGIVTVVALLAQEQAAAEAKAKAYADTLEDGTHRITKATREMVKENLAANRSFLFLNYGSAYDNAEKLGISLDLVTDAAIGNADALKLLDRQLTEIVGSGTNLEYANAATEIRNAVKGESSSVEEAIRVAEQKNRVTEEATGVTEENTDVTQTAAEAYSDAASEVDGLKSNLEQLLKQIDASNDAGVDAITSNIDYKNALAEVRKEIKSGKQAWGDSTKAGRDHMATLAALSEKSRDAANAQLALDGNTEAYYARVKADRATLINLAKDFGASAEEAENFADAVYTIPPKAEVEVIAETAAATKRLEHITAAINALPKEKRIGIVLTMPNGKEVSDQQLASQFGFGSADGNLIEAYANGGIREHHVAQMARAGAYRVWAEPETGGESYIPHAESKRGRAEQIMAETASILGGTYIPSGARQFAEGAMVPVRAVRASSPESGVIHTHVYLDRRQIAEAMTEYNRSLSGG